MNISALSISIFVNIMTLACIISNVSIAKNNNFIFILCLTFYNKILPVGWLVTIAHTQWHLIMYHNSQSAFQPYPSMCAAEYRRRITFFVNLFQNSNFHCHIWIQHEKCITMSTNKPSLELTVLESQSPKELIKYCLF